MKHPGLEKLSPRELDTLHWYWSDHFSHAAQALAMLYSKRRERHVPLGPFLENLVKARGPLSMFELVHHELSKLACGDEGIDDSTSR